MPMLADLDHPSASRTRDLLIGALCGLPVVGAAGVAAAPQPHGSVLGSAGDYDQRLRAEDAYMQAVCSQAFDLARDEQLCECVLAVEFPALDCRQPFLRWSLDRHHERCAEPEVRKPSLTFCSCIDTLAGADRKAELADESIDRRPPAGRQVPRAARRVPAARARRSPTGPEVSRRRVP
jgi:hypothetical protein